MYLKHLNQVRRLLTARCEWPSRALALPVIPALRVSVSTALGTLPWQFVAEEFERSDAQSVVVGDRTETLTNFQNLLWKDLISKNSVAFKAPTSGGKSFVLELYLASLFEADRRTVVYIVPTRALISQVSSELGELFRAHHQAPPDMITVPLRPTAKTPHKAIYIMTQERVQIVCKRNQTSMWMQLS